MQFEHFRIFPTSYIKTNIDRAFTKTEMRALDQASDYAPNVGNLISSTKTVLNDPRLHNLRDACMQAVNQYRDQIMRPFNQVDFYITQSWLNKTEPGRFHHAHTHGNSILSGVLYINADRAHDRIYFVNPVPEPTISFGTRDYTLDNSQTWYVEVGTGDLILFPSNLRHYVETNREERERVSLAFNTFATGTFGEDNGANKLVLEGSAYAKR